MRRIIFSVIAMAVTLVAIAAPVTRETTHKMATLFFMDRGGMDSLIELRTEFNNLRIYVGDRGCGFVIMSPDDAATPVVGYSVTNTFPARNMSETVRAWLRIYDNQVAYVRDHELNATAEIEQQWTTLDRMINCTGLRRMPPFNRVDHGNLLKTTWNQSTYYNNMCPYDSVKSTHTLTGSTAIAMAQIMKYWGFPANGVGTHTYTHPVFGTLGADYNNANYDWNLMPDALNAQSSSDEVNAVAKLIYHIGISLNMNYGVEYTSAYGSGMGLLSEPSVDNSLRNVFRYSHTAHGIAYQDYTTDDWNVILRGEIDHGRPILYGFPGHSLVCCGYDHSGLFYFNLGSGGLGDGFYATGAITSSRDTEGNLYSAIIGIEPNHSVSPVTEISATPSDPEHGTATGSGSYATLRDTVTITAHANPGFLFDRWNGSYTFNPYQFVADGINDSFTACYTEMNPDTMGYCRDYPQGLWMLHCNEPYRCGLRLDPVLLGDMEYLYKVMYFPNHEGEHIIRIYQGGDNAPEVEVLADTVYAYVTYEWIAERLSAPVAVDPSMPLWIVIESPMNGYPVLTSSYRGNIDGSWYATMQADATWTNAVTDDMAYYSFMIKGIFTDNPYLYEIVVTSNNDQWGSVAGCGFFNEGYVTVIEAKANAGCEFVRWSDGNVNPVRSITITGDMHFEAIFRRSASSVQCADAEEYVVTARSGNIIVQGAEGAVITVYDALGKMVAQRRDAQPTEHFSVANGVYFVRVNNQTTKIVVG